jgi:hypothetical protein
MFRVHAKHIIDTSFGLNPQSDSYQIEYTEKVIQETIDAYDDLFNNNPDIKGVLIFNDMASYADAINIGTASENAIAKLAIYGVIDHMQSQINLQGLQIFQVKDGINNEK